MLAGVDITLKVESKSENDSNNGNTFTIPWTRVVAVGVIHAKA